jgi:hypothetical protein
MEAAMATDEQTAPASVTDVRKPTHLLPRFGMKSLMVLPVLAAAVMAIDRWTAVPWSGPKEGGCVVFRIVDGKTGQPFKAASMTLFDGERQLATMSAPWGVIEHCGGHRQAEGYRSLVRDTRRLNIRDLRIRVTAAGFRDFEADASEISRGGRPDPGDSSYIYVVRLRPL